MSTIVSKVALVTGSGKRRVGNAVVEALAARGYDVAIHYNRSADEAQRTVLRLKERGRRAAAFQADVAREADVNRLIEQTLNQFGRIDVLVTAAAVWVPRQLEDVSADDLQREFEINTLGTFLCAQKAGLAMARRPEGGVIVTIGDWATVRPYRDYAAYFASKGSIPTITRSLAIELAARNPAVRVNCILPGPVMLPDDMPADERQRVINATLVKREGRPEHVAHAVVFLIENDFVTGVCLPVDGGRTIAGSGAIS
jgi:pteridine reductase